MVPRLLDTLSTIVGLAVWLAPFALGWYPGGFNTTLHVTFGALITTLARRYGSQAVVVAIDAKRVSAAGDTPRWEVFTHGGRKNTGLDVIEWARKMAEFGAGEILLTSMDRDGTKSGFDLALTRAVADAVGIPVIASGGVGTLEHLVEGVKQGHASAVLAASIFHYGTYTVAQAKEALQAAGIAVRL